MDRNKGERMKLAPIVVIAILLPFTGCIHESFDKSCTYYYHEVTRSIGEGDYFISVIGDGYDSVDYNFTRQDSDPHDIDIYFLDESNRAKFEDGDEFAYFDGLSFPSTQNNHLNVEGSLLPDISYYLVIDNSDRGDAAPNQLDLDEDEADFELELRADLPVEDGGCQ